MKKLACLFMTGALAVGMLSGCGSSSTETADTTAQTEETAQVANSETAEAADDAEVSTVDFDTDNEISVVSREDGSGTRGAFIELTGVQEKDADGNKIDNTTEEAIIANSTEIVLTTVAGDDYAIGYASLGSLNDSIKAVAVDGVEASVENIKSGSYKVSRPFNIATKGDVSDLAQDFINFIMSSEGQAVIEEKGYIAADDAAEAFASNGATGKIVVAGSSSVTPVMEKLMEAYMAINTGAEIEIQESDSTTGMTATIDGTCDIGMASRELSDSEVEAGLTNTVIAIDGIAVVVNNNNPVSDFSLDQIKGIFTGETTEWSEVE